MDRAEKIGLGTATAGHIVLFGLLSVGFLATPNPSMIERHPVEVTFAKDVGLEATARRASTQPPATSVAPELGKPEEAPKEQAQNQPEPAPQPAEPVPAPVPTPTPKPNKPPVRQPQTAHGARLGPDFLKGLTETASVSRATEASAPNIGPREKASLAAELKRQLAKYWRAPTGADVENLSVVIEARLAPDGSIVGEPIAHEIKGVTLSNRAQASVFTERAIAAVKRAAPFQFPQQYYDVWKKITPRFDKDLG